MPLSQPGLNVWSQARIARTVVSVLTWSSYSSLHKWFVLSFACLIMSWQFSLWSLVPIFLAASFAGVKLSEQILHHKKVSHVAEWLFFKLESAYIDMRKHGETLHALFMGNSHVRKNDDPLIEKMSPELGSAYELDGDRCDGGSSSNIPVRLSTSLMLELNSIQLLIIRDFVCSWYSTFSYDPQFLKETKYYLQGAFQNVIVHVAQQDAHVMLTRVVRLYLSHFITFQQAHSLYNSHIIHPGTKVAQQPTFRRHSSINEAFESFQTWHPALDSDDAELSYLKSVVSVLVLSSCNAQVIDGSCVKTVLIQILTNKVMLPLMDLISSPDWLLQAITILTSDNKVASHSSTTYTTTFSTSPSTTYTTTSSTTTSSTSSTTTFSTSLSRLNENFGAVASTSTHLANTHLTNTHLTNTHPANTHLTNTHLTNTHLTNTHLTNTHLANTHLTNTEAAKTGTVITHLANRDLCNSNTHLDLDSHKHPASHQLPELKSQQLPEVKSQQLPEVKQPQTKFEADDESMLGQEAHCFHENTLQQKFSSSSSSPSDATTSYLSRSCTAEQSSEAVNSRSCTQQSSEAVTSVSSSSSYFIHSNYHKADQDIRYTDDIWQRTGPKDIQQCTGHEDIQQCMGHEDIQLFNKENVTHTNQTPISEFMAHSFSSVSESASVDSASDEDMKTTSDSELDSDVTFNELFSLDQDPQTIMSYGQTSSLLLHSSNNCNIEHSTENRSVFIEHSSTGRSPTKEHSSEEHSISADISEPVSSSFPKLFSIKNFVDSLKTSGKQSFVKKPKSLSLFSEKLSSNFNPLLHRASFRQKNNTHAQQEPPQLLVDGVPVDSHTLRVTECLGTSYQPSPMVSDPEMTSCQPSPMVSDPEMTPSPGFVSSFLSHDECQAMSPIPTPSPTDQADFAVIQRYNELKPFEMDDRRIFQDVRIPHTSVSREFRSTSQFSLYNIQYEALYFTEEGESVIRSGQARRRYREFLSLQSRLESHRGYRKFLKNMKVPKRWPTIPFKSNDKETVETRRLFLEKYLKGLIDIEAICNGPDLREFLAYEGDSHIAFVNKSPDIGVPRIDKMLMRGVSEVVDRIKALPNIPQEMMSGLRGRETLQEKHSREQTDDDSHVVDVNTAYLLDVISEEMNIIHVSSLQVLQDLDTEDEKDIIHSVITDPKNVEQANEACELEVESLLASLPVDEGARLPDSKESDIALCEAVLDLLVQGLLERDHWMCRERVFTCLHSVFGKALNRYLESAISSLTSDAQLVNYLKTLRETIWPKGHLRSNSETIKTEEQKHATREEAKRCLINFFPASFRFVVGKKQFEEVIDDFIGSLHSQKMNRHILYVILDMLIEQLFPEVRGHELLHRLLFSRSRNVQMSKDN